MLVEQAVFTSAQTRQTQGYHLVSRSPGIDESDAQELIRWSPTHAGLMDDGLDADSINFFRISDRWVVLSRSIYGVPEYSGRGGFQIVTYIVLLRPEQMAGYRNNAMVLASTLLSRGLLRFQSHTSSQLERLEIPDRSVLADYHSARMARSYGRSAVKILDSLRGTDRVAVLGAADPTGITGEVLQQLEDPQRSTVTFATGMKPSANRPFDVQFFKDLSPQMERQLTSQGVACCRV